MCANALLRDVSDPLRIGELVNGRTVLNVSQVRLESMLAALIELAHRAGGCEALASAYVDDIRRWRQARACQ